MHGVMDNFQRVEKNTRHKQLTYKKKTNGAFLTVENILSEEWLIMFSEKSPDVLVNSSCCSFEQNWKWL